MAGSEKAAHLQPVCSRCRESHKTQVWLCFLVVSFFAASTCAASGLNTADFQKCFTVMRDTNWMSLRESDALLYAPSTEDIQDNCDCVSLKCYTEELKMVLDELQIADNTVDCILDFNEALAPPLDGCPVCETYPLGNITIFLERLDTLLKRMTTQNHV